MGLCVVKETATSGGTPTEFEDIIDGSTSLEVEEGEEMEALIEGGEAEARRKKPDKYLLKMSRRIGNTSDVSGKLGMTDNIYSVEVVPEQASAIGATLTTVSRNVTARFDSTDGLVADYVYKTKGQTNASGALTDISFTAKSASQGGG